MKNDTRSHVFNRHPTLRIGVPVALLAFYVNQSWADVPPPPPSYHKPIDTSFPSGKALERQGYDPKTGVWKVNVNKDGKPKVSSNGSTVTGTQNVRITATDAYGNKATIRGKITQSASTAIIVGHIANAAVDGVSSYSQQFGNAIKQGNWGSAAHYAVMTGGAVIDGMFGGAISKAAEGFGRGIGTLPPARPTPPSTGFPSPPSSPSVNGSSASSQSSALSSAANAAASAQSAAEKSGDVGGALAAAAVGKAAGAAAQAAKGNADYQQAQNDARQKKEVYQVLLQYTDYGVYPVKTRSKYVGAYTDKQGESYAEYTNGSRKIVRSSFLDGHLPGSLKGSGSARVSTELFSVDTPPPESVKPSDMTLSGDDIKDVLERMFSSQQTNHAAMMSALSQIAANTAPKSPSTSDSSVGSSQSSDSRTQVGRSGPSIVDKATTSYTVSGDSAISAPYTPAGSDTPQQTRFDVNADGTVTATAVPRPDLKPHSSQAPTRHSVAPSAPNTQGSTQDAPSVPNQNHGTQANTNQGQHGQQSGQNQQRNDRQNFCQLNPNAAACIPPGNADYEDLSIPESVIDLSFQPADIFQTDGVCPQPKTVDLGIYGVQEFSYQPLCDFATALRPILIAATIMMCAWFAYGALGEA